MYLKSNIVDKYKFKSYSTFHLCLILFGNFWVESCSPLSVSMSTSRGGWSWARIIMMVTWLSLAAQQDILLTFSSHPLLRIISAN